MKLIIVESPTKARTIEKFLKEKYKVLPSFGHVKDLPKNKFGVDIKNDFKTNYITIPKAKKTIHFLKKEVKKTDIVCLATDPDREGEAIAYHLVSLLNLDKKRPYQRIIFHEITKSAIKEALKNPRKIDLNLVEAQQTRRVLDRIVGYKLSPFLWKKVARGLSAGRVQSVAVRLVIEREKEIENFVPQEYWTIEALFQKEGTKGKKEFKALLVKEGRKEIPKLGIGTKEKANEIVKNLKGAEYKVERIEKKEAKRNPLPPFTTSALEQEAWQRFKWPAKLTMGIAQQLYEKGLTTYHRTDSLNLSKSALLSAKKFIIENYGKEYWVGFLRKYKAKGRVQEAHEAIRPTYPERVPEKIKIQTKLDNNQTKLYDLIWRRFLACQMAPAIFDSTLVDISAKNYLFQTRGQVLKFEGFLKVYPLKYGEVELPLLEKGEILELIKLIPLQHFTQPPPRYTEASLIKELEKNGIGRPSTYAPILSTIQERNYVEKDEKRHFRPTEIGKVVNDILVNHFPEVVDIGFTAKMEENLDKIASGQKKRISVLEDFYTPFEKNLQKKYKEISKKDLVKETEKICPKCSSPLLIRLGKFGRFYACSRFPKCKYTQPLKENTLGIKCPKCKEGEIVEKRTKKRKVFYGCSNWPKCDFALWYKPTGEICPKCGSLLIERRPKEIKCSNKKCNYKKAG